MAYNHTREVPGGEDADINARSKIVASQHPPAHGTDRARPVMRSLLAATLIVAVAAGIAPLLQRLPHANLSLLFLTGVLVVAVRYGVWPSIYASILSFFVFTFFFTSPYLTLTIRDEGDVATLVFFLVVASVTGNLASRLRDAMANSEREKLRSALLTSLSHDLRTPLAAVIGAASSVLAYEQTLSTGDKRVLLQSVLEESERLDRYVQNLLDMLRLDSGRIPLQRDWLDLRDLISAASRRLRLAARGIRVRTSIADDAHIVFVHGGLVEQVFVNLLDNAAQHSPPQGTITIRASREDEVVIVEVADEGPGIPESERERVFDPFYRVREGDQKSGTGLGLSICRGIIRAHGGDTSAHAERGSSGGALLRFTIPGASGHSSAA